jgi:anti-sigma regulatory factor (Ser/Thr protein kinase)
MWQRSSPRSSESIPELRTAVTETASPLVAPALLPEVALVVSELVTNAVRHGVGDSITVEVLTTPDEFGVSVVNQAGPARPPPPSEWRMPGPEAASGRGLGIVRGLAPAVAVDDGEDHVGVTASWPRWRGAST